MTAVEHTQSRPQGHRPGAFRVVEHEWIAYRREWRGTLFTSFLSPLLYLAAMGIGLGTLVDDGAVGAGEDLSYLAWLAPGLLAASAMQTGAMEASWPVVAGFKWLRIFEAAVTTPICPRDLVTGRMLWTGLRLTLVLAVFALVSVVLDAMTLLGALGALPFALLAGLATNLTVMVMSSRMDATDQVAAIFRYGVVPMFLFSGTFFPIDQLPQLFQPVAWATPLWHGVELSRWAALGLDPAAPAVVHVGVLLAYGLVGHALSARQFERRLIA